MTENEKDDLQPGPLATSLAKLPMEEACWVATRVFLRALEQFGTDPGIRDLPAYQRAEIVESVFIAGISGFARCSKGWNHTSGLIAAAALQHTGGKTYPVNAGDILQSADAVATELVTIFSAIVAAYAIQEYDKSILDPEKFRLDLSIALEKVHSLLMNQWESEPHREEFARLPITDMEIAREVVRNGKTVPVWGSFQTFALASVNEIFPPRMKSRKEGEFNRLVDDFLRSVDQTSSFDLALQVLESWGVVTKVNRDGSIRVSGFLGHLPVSDSGVRVREGVPKPDGQGPLDDPTDDDEGDRTEEMEQPVENIHVEGRFVSEAAILSQSDDHLGFGHAARAVSDFVASEDTRLPLTISVEGEWGAGKSSFLNLVREDLSEREFVTLWFNPWRYETMESMWAAFALSITDQLKSRGGLGFWQRRKNEILIGIERIRKGASAWKIFRGLIGFIGWFLAFSLALVAIVLVTTDRDQSVVDLVEELIESGKNLVLLPLIAAVLPYVKKLLELSGNPLGDELRSYFQAPDYAAQATILQNFHSEVREVLRAYSADRKIALFIDDLDRCDPHAITEILRTLNLFLALDQDESSRSGAMNSRASWWNRCWQRIRGRSGKRVNQPSSSPRQISLVTFVGMDREKVAACLASKHKDLLPYLSSLEETSGGDTSLAVRSLRFGYRYLEKFVHLGVSMPRPGGKQLTRFLDSICPASEDEREAVPTGSEPIPDRRMASRSREEETGFDIDSSEVSDGPLGIHDDLIIKSYDSDGVEIDRREGRGEIERRETTLVRSIAELAVPILGHNPRRVKQFVNLYRLRIRLAVELGLYLPRGRKSDGGGLSLEQIGKLIAVEMSAPAFFSELRDDPRLFIEDREAHEAGAAPLYSPRKQLGDKPRLLAFLHYAPDGLDDAETARWRFEGISLEGYFQIGLATELVPLPDDEESRPTSSTVEQRSET